MSTVLVTLDDIMAPRNRIAELRAAKNWSQQDLADAAGTTNQQIGRLENGNRKLTVDWLERIASALKVTPKDLLADDTVPLVGYVRAGVEAYLYALFHFNRIG